VASKFLAKKHIDINLFSSQLGF